MNPHGKEQKKKFSVAESNMQSAKELREKVPEMALERTQEDMADSDLASRRILSMFDYAAKGSKGSSDALQEFLSLTNPALRDRYFDQQGRVVGTPDEKDLAEMVSSAQQIMGITKFAESHFGGGEQPQAPQQAIGEDSVAAFNRKFLGGQTVQNRPVSGQFYQDIANRPAESMVHAPMNPNRVVPEPTHGSPEEFQSRYLSGRYIPAGYQQDGQVYQDMANRAPQAWDPNAPMSPTNGDDEINRLTHEAIASRVGYHRPEPRGAHNSPEEFIRNFTSGKSMRATGDFYRDKALGKAESYDPRAPLSPTNPDFDLVADILKREREAGNYDLAPMSSAGASDNTTATPDKPTGTVVQHDTTAKGTSTATGAISTQPSGGSRTEALRRTLLQAAIAGGNMDHLKTYNTLLDSENLRDYRNAAAAGKTAGAGSTKENWQLIQNDDGTYSKFNKYDGSLIDVDETGAEMPHRWKGNVGLRSRESTEIINTMRRLGDGAGSWKWSNEYQDFIIRRANGEKMLWSQYKTLKA